MSDSCELGAAERQWRAAATLTWPLALGAAPVILAVTSVPLCAFRQLIGQPCPLCGGTHACAALAEGNLLAAWQAAPALMPVLALALVHTVQLAYEALYARRVAPAWRIGACAWGAAGAAMLVLWGMRLAGLV